MEQDLRTRRLKHNKRESVADLVTPAQPDLPLLRCKNYQLLNQDDDSIDVWNIVHGKDEIDSRFDVQTLSKWKIPENMENLRANNYENKIGQDHPHQKDLQKTLEASVLPMQQKASLCSSQSSYKGTKQLSSRIKLKPVKPEERSSSFKYHRRETYPKDTLDNIIADFHQLSKAHSRVTMLDMSQRYHLSMSCLVHLHKEWKEDPQLAKYSNSKEEPMGALVGGKRQRTIERMRIIKEMLDQNPYLTQKDISDRLFKLDPSKKRVLRSAIIRLMRLSGYRKVRKPVPRIVRQQCLPFVHQYQKKETQGGQFYYLGQHLFHESSYNQAFWTCEKKDEPPTLSSYFYQQGILMVALLTPDCQLLWQTRKGQYSPKQYSTLISRMLSKFSSKTNKVLINSQNSLRDRATLDKIAHQHSYNILSLPHNSIMLSPLQGMFVNLQQQMRRVWAQHQSNPMNHLCSLLSDIQQQAAAKVDECTKHRVMVLTNRIY